MCLTFATPICEQPQKRPSWIGLKCWGESLITGFWRLKRLYLLREIGLRLIGIFIRIYFYFSFTMSVIKFWQLLFVAIGYVVCKFSRLLINSGKQFKITVWCVLDNGGSDLRKLVKIDMLNWNMIVFIFYLCFMIYCLDDYCYDTGISTNINLDICFSYIFSHRKRSI